MDFKAFYCLYFAAIAMNIACIFTAAIKRKLPFSLNFKLRGRFNAFKRYDKPYAEQFELDEYRGQKEKYLFLVLFAVV